MIEKGINCVKQSRVDESTKCRETILILLVIQHQDLKLMKNPKPACLYVPTLYVKNGAINNSEKAHFSEIESGKNRHALSNYSKRWFPEKVLPQNLTQIFRVAWGFDTILIRKAIDSLLGSQVSNADVMLLLHSFASGPFIAHLDEHEYKELTSLLTISL